MSKWAKLLNKSEAEVARLISSLEHATGYESTDVRYLAEHHRATRQKISQLGLDANDTTAEELYQSLLARYGRDSQIFDKSIGLNAADKPEEILSAATKFLKHQLADSEVWAIKPAALKKLLLQQPPAKAAKTLGYRSINSMVKRERLATIMAAIEIYQSPSWRQRFNRAVSKLSNADYEIRSINIQKAKLSPNKLVSADSIIGALILNSQPVVPELNALSVCLEAYKLAAGLSARILRTSPITAVPALRWWQNAEHIIHLSGNTPISFNIHDVANNYMNAFRLGEHTIKQASLNLEDQLLNAYKVKSAEVPVEAVNEEETIKQLAAEAVEV